eukprot:GGOE01054999.1.p1 GENE.GGOE01054999.1~~GGOE01054999.1.p1  ORF type:complete len:413 (-),score=72.65 GGOE01054999.1:367-1605(-)
MVNEQPLRGPSKGRRILEARAHEPALQSYFARDKVGAMRTLYSRLGSDPWEEVATVENLAVTVEDLPTAGFQVPPSVKLDASEVPCLRRPSVYPSETSSCMRDYSEPGRRFKPMLPPCMTPAALRLLPRTVQQHYQSTGRGVSNAARLLLLLKAERSSSRGRKLTAEEQQESCTRLLGVELQQRTAAAAACRMKELAESPPPRLTREDEVLLVRRLHDECLLVQEQERIRIEQKHQTQKRGKRGRRTRKVIGNIDTFLDRLEVNCMERAVQRARLLEKYAPVEQQWFDARPKTFTLKKAIELSTTKSAGPQLPSPSALRQCLALWTRGRGAASEPPPLPDSPTPPPLSEEPTPPTMPEETPPLLLEEPTLPPLPEVLPLPTEESAAPIAASEIEGAPEEWQAGTPTPHRPQP